MLGVAPIEGRWFLPEEDQPGHEPVVILSHRLWQTRFGGESSVVGSRVTLDGSPFTVVGIMGPAFTFPDWAQVWTPLAWTEKERAVRGEHSLMVVARLAPGVDAPARHRRIWRRSRGPSSRSPGRRQGVGRGRGADARRSRRRRPDLAARAARRRGPRAAHRVCERREPRARPHLARRREMAVRLALGAGAGRIVRQVLTETTVLARRRRCAGAAGGASRRQSHHRVLWRGPPAGVPMHVDWQVLAFTVASSRWPPAWEPALRRRCVSRGRM